MNPGDVISHTGMCSYEGQMLQRGMTFRAPPRSGVILMSLRKGAPYVDAVRADGTLEYEGHDASRSEAAPVPKAVDQPARTPRGTLTENGKFAEWTDRFVRGEVPPARFHVYEKLQDGIWTFRGVFELRAYRLVWDGTRHVFRFDLIPTSAESQATDPREIQREAQTRQIPTLVKQFVYKRDRGRCVICGSNQNLHYDHDLPFSLGGSSATERNVRLLCATHNLAKSNRIE